MAVYLARRGHRVTLYESRHDPRAEGYRGGRSINLALSARGLDALARVGLADRVLEEGIRMPGRMLHDREGKQVFQPYSANPRDAINSVSRGGLNIQLLDAAEAMDNVTIRFDRKCVDCDPGEGGGGPAVSLESSAGKTYTDAADLVIGADGAYSAVRYRLQRTGRFNYSQSYLEHGYKELEIPPTSSGAFAIEPNALHIWPRGGSMMIALPNIDKTFTCTLFWPYAGEHSFEAVHGDEGVRAHFEREYGDAVPLMPTLVEDYTKNPVGSLVTVRCSPWVHEGKVALLGDAAHALVPFFGQGMNCAFEDCVELDRCLAEDDDWSRALAEYSAVRVDNANAIADMALENFIEMRDLTARPEFRYRKKLEQALHALRPDAIHPRYNLVSFSTIPYTEAVAEGERMDAILDRFEERLPLGSIERLGESAWEQEVARLSGELLGASA